MSENRPKLMEADLTNSIEEMLQEYEGVKNTPEVRSEFNAKFLKFVNDCRDQYEFICDESNNPQSIIDENRIVISLVPKHKK